MSAAVCDIAVHIDENLNDRELVNLEAAIRSDFGVVSVGHDRDRHMVFVLYDPEVLRGKDILDRVTNQGFHAELIGF